MVTQFMMQSHPLHMQSQDLTPDEKLARMNMLGTKAKSERYRFLIRSTRQRAWACKLQLLLFPRGTPVAVQQGLANPLDLSTSPLQSLALLSSPPQPQRPDSQPQFNASINSESSSFGDFNSWIPQSTSVAPSNTASVTVSSPSLIPDSSLSTLHSDTLSTQHENSPVIPVAPLPTITSQSGATTQPEWTVPSVSVTFSSFESLLASIHSSNSVLPSDDAEPDATCANLNNTTSSSTTGVNSSTNTQDEHGSADTASTLAAVAAAVVTSSQPVKEPAEGVVPELPEVHVVQHVTSCIDDVVGNPDPYQPRKRSPLKKPNPETLVSPSDSESDSPTSPVQSSGFNSPEPLLLVAPRMSRKRSSSSAERMQVDPSVSLQDSDDMISSDNDDNHSISSNGSCSCSTTLESSKRCKMSIAYPSPPDCDMTMNL